MGSEQGFVDALMRGSLLPYTGLGMLVAVGLLGALRLLLPRHELYKLRTPLGLLIGHLVAVLLTALLHEMEAFSKVLQLAALLLLLICLGRAGFLLVVDAILSRRFAKPIPKIFRDILEGLVYMAALLVVLRQAGAQLDALLTTSALLTAVIGLSLQDTLGNLFAGLSIQAQNPFEIGDWIQFDEYPEKVGRVVEINWRATKVVTLDRVEIVIPNGPLARASIRNFSKPTALTRRSLFVVVPFRFAPQQVREAILGAIDGTPNVNDHPAPTVVVLEFGDRGIRYWIRYFTEDYERREDTDASVRERIWHALRRAGIEFAIPVADLEVVQDDETARKRERDEAVARKERVLHKVDFCRVLPEPQLRSLAEAAMERTYAAGERVIREGDRGEEFFIVQSGELAVLIGSGDGEVEVARLQAGSFFGEMSMMTGEPRTATVRAVQPAQLLVVDKAAFGQVLDASPELAETISEALVARQEQLGSASSKSQNRKLAERARLDERKVLLHRIKEFFSL